MFDTHRGALRSIACAVAVCFGFCSASAAQTSQAGDLPNAPSASVQSSTPSQQEPRPSDNTIDRSVQTGVQFFQILQQKSLVFPDLATNRQPFGAWDKFKLAANNSVSLSTVTASLLGAAWGQAINSPEGYGQGGSGYGKRFGASMARAASANMFGTFLLASALHEDPRFYVKKNLSFGQSVKYAAYRVVKTRRDSGEEVTNFAGLLGPLAAEALACTYYPEGNRGVGDVLLRYASDQGWKFGGNLLRQYWPAINHKLKLAPPPN